MHQSRANPNSQGGQSRGKLQQADDGTAAGTLTRVTPHWTLGFKDCSSPFFIFPQPSALLVGVAHHVRVRPVEGGGSSVWSMADGGRHEDMSEPHPSRRPSSTRPIHCKSQSRLANSPPHLTALLDSNRRSTEATSATNPPQPSLEAARLNDVCCERPHQGYATSATNPPRDPC